jgi:hypothetical protein
LAILSAEGEWQEDSRLLNVTDRILERRGEDPDNLERLVVQSQDLAEDLRITFELRSPEPVADNCDFWSIRILIVCRERPASRRGCAKHLEIPSADTGDQCSFGLTRPEQGVGAPANDRHLLEKIRALAPIKEFARHDPGGPSPGGRIPKGNGYEAVTLVVRKRSQDGSIDEREDGGIGPDPEREREGGCNGKPGRPTKDAKSKFQILKH